MSSVKKGLALIIANADYQSQPQLPSCHKDGTDMKAKLEQLNFDVLYYTNTTRKTILEAISEFIKLADCYSVLLVYYTGHGVQIDGENYFVPIDCIYHPVKSVFIASSLVGVNTITQYMNEHEEKTNIFFHYKSTQNETLSFFLAFYWKKVSSKHLQIYKKQLPLHPQSREMQINKLKFWCVSSVG